MRLPGRLAAIRKGYISMRPFTAPDCLRILTNPAALQYPRLPATSGFVGDADRVRRSGCRRGYGRALLLAADMLRHGLLPFHSSDTITYDEH